MDYYEQRIEQLVTRVSELEKKLHARSEESVDLSTRKTEIDQLQKIAAEISRRLEMMDISADAPEQETIRVIQPAVVTGADASDGDRRADTQRP